MATFPILDAETRSVIADALDSLLLPAEQGGLGKWCRLLYPPRYVPCVNCVLNPTSGRSTGRYRSGGPMPFVDGRCPLCLGEGRKAEEASENIVLGTEWEPKKFIVRVPNAELRMPYSLLQTKGYLKDASKLLKAEYLEHQVPNSGIVRQRFKLLAAPGDRSSIVQGRYFFCVWEQWNG